ncbi:MAG TPA: universal stress protein, partial [Paracoccaceae bacterium]|nr:universal stress protein [Paracoccaceae bacterium]
MRNGALLAWDGGRAGARALADAMATVLNGARLTVLHVGEDDSEVRRPGRDVMQHLGRHGLHAELVVVPRASRPVAEIVLESAEASGAGLLIMGAYEHSRLGEALLGGVTRDVLRQATLPVLVAH